MAKIVYNTCFGGFGLSDAAIIRYAQLAGLAIEKRTDTWGDTWCTADGEYFDGRYIDREDPHLIQVIEELGTAANGRDASLTIREIPDGALYHIDEYDGNESVMMLHEYGWHKAGR